MAIRISAGATYLDIGDRFDIGTNTLYTIMWEVIDAINNNGEVGAFYFPHTASDCERVAADFKVKVKTYPF